MGRSIFRDDFSLEPESIKEFADEDDEDCIESGNGFFSNGTSDDNNIWSEIKLQHQLQTTTRTAKKKNQVLLEGYVESADEDDLSRTKSLTDDDLEELKGCLDLGFGFSYEEIPELCNTLPALELCYSVTQRFLDEQQRSPESSSPRAAESSSQASGPIANWKISSPGDDPEDVKARLKYWAQAVACTVRLCN